MTSDDAKKVYTHVTTAVLRGCDEVAKVATELKENCEDIHADAKNINDIRAKEKQEKVIADARAVLGMDEDK